MLRPSIFISQMSAPMRLGVQRLDVILVGLFSHQGRGAIQPSSRPVKCGCDKVAQMEASLLLARLRSALLCCVPMTPRPSRWTPDEPSTIGGGKADREHDIRRLPQKVRGCALRLRCVEMFEEAPNETTSDQSHDSLGLVLDIGSKGAKMTVVDSYGEEKGKDEQRIPHHRSEE